MIRTWVQLTFGGNGVVFHAETIGNDSHQWECEQEECDICRELACDMSHTAYPSQATAVY